MLIDSCYELIRLFCTSMRNETKCTNEMKAVFYARNLINQTIISVKVLIESEKQAVSYWRRNVKKKNTSSGISSSQTH